MNKKVAALLSIATLALGFATTSFASHECYWIYTGTRTTYDFEQCHISSDCGIYEETIESVYTCETCSARKYEHPRPGDSGHSLSTCAGNHY